jgi:hypothetical protein
MLLLSLMLMRLLSLIQLLMPSLYQSEQEPRQ